MTITNDITVDTQEMSPEELQELWALLAATEDHAVTPGERHMLSIPDHTGDTRIMWDPRDKHEANAAKAAFDSAIKNGMVAYAVNQDGSPDQEAGVVRSFPKKAGKVIMVKQLVGG